MNYLHEKEDALEGLSKVNGWSCIFSKFSICTFQCFFSPFHFGGPLKGEQFFICCFRIIRIRLNASRNNDEEQMHEQFHYHKGYLALFSLFSFAYGGHMRP